MATEETTPEVASKATEAAATEVTTEVTAEETATASAAEEKPAAAAETTTEVTETETTEVTETAEAETNPLEKFQTEFNEKQSLTDESYSELGEMGYSREMVDAYIRGATTVLSADEADTLIENFGGQEAFDDMRGWAGKNLTAAELETFNGALQTKASSEMAMTWLKGKMEASEGYDPEVNLSGIPAGAPKADVFTGKHEVKAVIKDPRWGKDKAWTREMEAKIGRSRLF